MILETRFVKAKQEKKYKNLVFIRDLLLDKWYLLFRLGDLYRALIEEVDFCEHLFEDVLGDSSDACANVEGSLC